jgi:hypothetical protein
MGDTGADLRVSDEERQLAADRLRESFAVGRLSIEEYEQRLASVLAAKTRGDVAPQIRDLPTVAAPTAALTTAQRGHRLRGSQLAWEAFGLATTFLVCVGVWFASGGNGQFWPLWVGLVALLRLARTARRTLGPAGAGRPDRGSGQLESGDGSDGRLPPLP